MHEVLVLSLHLDLALLLLCLESPPLLRLVATRLDPDVDIGVEVLWCQQVVRVRHDFAKHVLVALQVIPVRLSCL